ncbi:16S rRNA (adenine(1518)-N(6)/adenine(1519)-N(6))-dimethyltransferase RsmA [Isachenkonia alkalipeptolytica]|uniref:Ribosomal RNA small subunit methyltransferase A n=1 Tax=Isachenkonia alkalipeptolytica TaxID=2565777 RepID=A0AA44BFI4_9CLOT|nr:16S rRNA (adenine(1518)-N(6)/adenine(1519)-N(6))-dimethyltransferase RsmA [Isachenkonia alkalipeptolytica]NBG89070.1 16S rRNA (adenine(1518)-N(6)/adenine(1519)-N(6))-dimethyltransferase RsmA [Isachenkonia alkalipeptolytica]
MRIATPTRTRTILSEYGHRMRKSLGQNFLIDGNIIENIIEGAGVTEVDTVLEIGPGIGSMTEVLSEKAKKVIAVEIDQNLIPILEKTLAHRDNIEIIHQDILKLDLEDLKQKKGLEEGFKVVANLPYYVTTPIIMALLEGDAPIRSITVMIQKEVADRILSAKDVKAYGALTVACNLYADVREVLTVPPSVFLPRPKVASKVITLTPKVNNLTVQERKLLFAIVKDAFGKRRKTLLNSLSSGNLGYSKDRVREALEAAEIDPKKRAENLGIEDFKRIMTAFAEAEKQ